MNIEKVGAVVLATDPKNELRVLLRKNSPFNGSPEEWNVIYGHIDSNETLESCAIREIKEEVDIHIKAAADSGCRISKSFSDNKHITITYFWVRVQEMLKSITLNEESIGYQWAKLADIEMLISDPDQASAVLHCAEACAKGGVV